MNSNLFERNRKIPLYLSIPLPIGAYRLIAEIFPHRESGIVFFDIFWQDAVGRHPIHHVPGEIIERPTSWRVGDASITELEDYPQRMREWERWLSVREDWPLEKIEEIAAMYGALV